MATTNTNVLTNEVIGRLKITTTTVVPDASYPTGGEPLTPAQLGLSTVQFAICTVKTAGVGSITAADYDIANSKLLLYTAAAQAGNTLDASAVTIQVVAFGY